VLTKAAFQCCFATQRLNAGKAFIFVRNLREFNWFSDEISVSVYAVLSSVSIFLMVLASLVKIRFRNSSCHDPEDPSKYKMTVNFMESWIQLWRAILVIISVFWASSSSKSVLAGLSFLMFLISLVFWANVFRLSPHVFPIFSMIVSPVVLSFLGSLVFRKLVLSLSSHGCTSVHSSMPLLRARQLGPFSC
jgi:hypothetical protein